jgi:hypothetical protein
MFTDEDKDKINSKENEDNNKKIIENEIKSFINYYLHNRYANDSDILSFSLNCVEEEKNRTRNIEHKAAVYIGVLSVLITLLVAIESEFLYKICINTWTLIFLILFIVLSIFLCLCLFFSVNILNKTKQNYLSPTGNFKEVDKGNITINSTGNGDYISDSGEKYYQKIIIDAISMYYHQVLVSEKKIKQMRFVEIFIKLSMLTLFTATTFLIIYFIHCI